MKTTGLSLFNNRATMAAFIGVLGILGAPREKAWANDIALRETIYDTDYITAAVGGLRDSSTATINLSGLSGTVNKAYLYWHGPMNTTNPLANASIRVNGSAVTGANIGLSSDNCWGFDNSQSYRADVTTLVRAERNGQYALTQFVKQGTNINANGASLLVFYSDANTNNNRDIVLFEGNDSNAPNGYDADGWNVTLGGIHYVNGSASVQLHASDGQIYEDDAVFINGTTLERRGAVFQGATVAAANNGPGGTGRLWDVKTYDITTLLSGGSNTVNITHGYINRDCVSLVVAAINLPAGSAPPPPPANLPPAITGTPEITVNSPNAIVVPANVLDQDGNPLTYTIAIDGTIVQNGSIPAGQPTTSGVMSVTNAFALGQHTVVFTANDGQVNSTFTTVVNVIDNTPPVLNVPANIIVPTDLGKTNAVVNYEVTATDDFPGVTVISLPPPGTAFPIGTTTVTATAVDASGNRTQLTFTITVTDCMPPTVNCPDNLLRPTDPGTNNAVVRFTVPAHDNMPGCTITCTPATGSTFPIGITTVVCTARDSSGNTANCMFTVTIVDREPPVITVPANIVVPNDPGKNTAVVTYTVTVQDNAPGAIVNCVPPSGSAFPIGITPVVCIATDAVGNGATNSFTITVRDTEKPVLNVPPNLTVPAAPGTNVAVVTYTVTATDNSGTATVTCVPPSGSTFPMGTTPVNCTATDNAGNTTTGSFTVTVIDTQPPVLVVPPNITVPNTPGTNNAVVTYTVTATDNNGTPTVTCVPPSGSTFPIGATIVTCTAIDNSGNSTNRSFTITVVDNENPVLILPPNIIVPVPPGTTTTVVTYVVTGTDNNGTPTVTCVPPSGSSFPVGVTTVTCTAIDTTGNQTNGTFTITVTPNNGGNQPPVLTVPANMTVPNDRGLNTAVVTFTATVTDDQPGATIACVPASGSVFPLGVTRVTCVATDAGGLKATNGFTITVIDTENPVLTLPPNISVPAAPGSSNAIVAYTVTATDNSGSADVICVPASGSAFPIGATRVTCTAIDPAGNIATGSFTITVTDGGIEPPDAGCIVASFKYLWPANRKMIPVSVWLNHPTLRFSSARIVSVTSNEPETGIDALDIGPDWEIVNAHTLKLKLRAERFPTGTGRIYTITVEATGTDGQNYRCSTTVTVPLEDPKKKTGTKKPEPQKNSKPKASGKKN